MEWLGHLTKEKKEIIEKYDGTQHLDDLVKTIFIAVGHKTTKALSSREYHTDIDNAFTQLRVSNIKNEFLHLRDHAENHAQSAIAAIDNKTGANGQYVLAVIDKYVRELNAKIKSYAE